MCVSVRHTHSPPARSYLPNSSMRHGTWQSVLEVPSRGLLVHATRKRMHCKYARDGYLPPQSKTSRPLCTVHTGVTPRHVLFARRGLHWSTWTAPRGRLRAGGALNTRERHAPVCVSSSWGRTLFLVVVWTHHSHSNGSERQPLE